MNFLKTHTSILKIILFLGSIVFLALSLFSSFSGNEREKNMENTDANIAIVLDVSRSMNVRDMSGESRLQFAKKQIFEILSRYNGYNFALNIFAGESQRVLPFSSDISLFATFLQGLDSNNLSKQGTRIDLALQDGLASFGEEKTGTIIIVTDGDEKKIAIPQDIIKEIKQKQIEVFLLGVGTKKGGYIPTGDIFQPYKVYNGERVIAQLNEKELKSVAQKLGGTYLTDAGNIKLKDRSDIDKNGKNSFYLYLACIFWFAFVGISVFEIYRK